MEIEIIDGKEYVRLECKLSLTQGASSGFIWLLKSDLIEAVFGSKVVISDGKTNPFYKQTENTGV